MALIDHTGERCVTLSFVRSSDSRKEPTVRLTIQDEDTSMTELIDMTPKQFADLMSGMATWAPDGFAGHR